MKQWLSTKADVEGKEGNKRYTLSKARFRMHLGATVL